MSTLICIFFSIVAIFGFLKGRTKNTPRKMVLIGCSLFLIVGQILFLYSYLNIESQQFVGFSILISGIIFILAFQKSEAW
jgi:hypothetical protein